MKKVIPCLLGLIAHCAFGQVLVLNDSLTSISDFHENLVIYKDNSDAVTIAELLDTTRDFIFSPMEDVSLGFYSGSVWLKLPIQNDSDIPLWNLIINQPTLDSIEYYLLHDHEIVWSAITGDNLVFHSRPVLAGNFVFPIELKRSVDYTCLIRIRGEQNIFRIPVSIQSKPEWEHSRQFSQLLSGILYGFLLVMCLYSLLTFLFTGILANAYYATYVASILLFFATQNGHLFEYVLANYPSIFNALPILLVATGCISSVLFAINMLKISARSPIWWLLLGIILLMCTAPFLQFVQFRSAVSLAGAMSLLKSYSFVVIGCWAIWSGRKNAPYLLPGWLLYAVGITLFVCRNVGILPATFWTDYGLMVAVNLEVVIMWVVVILNHRQLLYEKIEAQEASRRKELELENERMHSQQLLMEKEKRDRKLTLSMLERKQQIEKLALLKDEPSEALLRRKLERLVASDQLESAYWEHFRVVFEEVHPHFFEYLQRTYPNLSVNDLRHLAYVKMNLQVKEISQLTGVSVQAVKMARNRLRKKINEKMTLAEIVGAA